MLETQGSLGYNLEEVHSMFDKNILSDIFTVLLSFLHMAGKKILKYLCWIIWSRYCQSHLQRPVCLASGVPSWLCSQPGPDTAEQVGEEPGMGDGCQAVRDCFCEVSRERASVGYRNHLEVKNKISLFLKTLPGNMHKGQLFLLVLPSCSVSICLFMVLLCFCVLLFIIHLLYFTLPAQMGSDHSWSSS